MWYVAYVCIIISMDYPISGVSSLRALLARDRDDDAPKLTMLLCESLISVYMSLLIHALSMYDANLLFRLVAHPFTEGMWPILFGGGAKKLIKLQPAPSDVHSSEYHFHISSISGNCVSTDSKWINLFSILLPYSCTYMCIAPIIEVQSAYPY
jgi:hypothetical protein